MGTISKKKWMKKKRRAMARKKEANKAKMRRQKKVVEATEKEIQSRGSVKTNPYKSVENPFAVWKPKLAGSVQLPSEEEVLVETPGALCMVGAFHPIGEVIDVNGHPGTVVGIHRDIYGNGIGSLIEVEDFHKVVSEMAPLQALKSGKSWRDKCLSFDGNKATYTWEEDGCFFEAETDLEPCVLGTVESLTDDEMVFRTDHGTYYVQVASKEEGERLLSKPRYGKDGYSKTLQKKYAASCKKWGQWGGHGLWRASSSMAVPEEQYRPRWKIVRWFHPEHGSGTYSPRGVPVRTGSAPSPVKEVA